MPLSKSAMFAELGTPTAPLPYAPEVPLDPQPERDARAARRLQRSLRAARPGSPRDRVSHDLEPKRKGIRARAQLVCDERVVVTRTFRKGQAKRTFDIPNLGPATCDVRLVSSVSATLRYTLHIAIAVETA